MSFDIVGSFRGAWGVFGNVATNASSDRAICVGSGTAMVGGLGGRLRMHLHAYRDGLEVIESTHQRKNLTAKKEQRVPAHYKFSTAPGANMYLMVVYTQDKVKHKRHLALLTETFSPLSWGPSQRAH